MTQARVILHMNATYHAHLQKTPRLAMFQRIRDMITARGGKVVLHPPPPKALPPSLAKGDGDLHIVSAGAARGNGWLNAYVAYFAGYWHINALGQMTGDELAARAPLLPPTFVDHAKAQAFFDTLCAKVKTNRRTRYEQPETTQSLPKNSIAVFLQGPAPERYGQHYFIMSEMIECVAKGAGGRAVLVKPHPLYFDQGAAQVHAAQAQGLNVILADAHLHDVLAACDVTVSINSAAAVEGFLYGKPTILFGQGDFAPMGETLLDPDDFPQAIERALATPRDYAGWLFWYLTQHAIPQDATDLEMRLLSLFAQAGFDADRIGLNRG